MPKVTHGHAAGGHSREYRAWNNMHSRCNDATLKSYGGKGVAVCTRWRSFENFLADMGLAPPGMSLDRRDNEGDYAPENCRWAARKLQQRNTSRNSWVTLHGERLTVQDWCERLDLNHRTVRKRLQLGWTVERSFLTPTIARYVYGRSKPSK